MARTPRRLARGTTVEVAAYTGPQGEPIFNQDTKRLHMQDGTTAGGIPNALLSDVESVAVASGTDLNTLVTRARTAVTNPTNAPVANAAYRWVIDTIVDPSDVDGISQHATLIDGGVVQLWVRRRTLAGTWEAWVSTTPTATVEFPSWRTSPGQFGANFASYLTARTAQSTKLAKLPRPSGAKVVGPDIGAVNLNYFSGVVRMAEAGRYFFVPYSSDLGLIYNERTGTYTTLATPVSGAGSHNGGALLPSGKIIMAPDNRTIMIAYNPYTEAFENLQTGLAGANAYSGICIGAGGKAVLIPHNASSPAIYDETGPTFTLSPNTLAGTNKYSGGVALPDGRVLCVPHNATRVAIVDTTTGATTYGAITALPNASSGTNESFVGGALIDEDRVLFFPHKHTHAVIYTISTDTWANFGSSINTLGTAGFNGGVRLADGRFFVVPFNSAAARILDIDAGTIYSPPGAYGSVNVGQCKGGVLMENGDVIMAPMNSEFILFATTGHGSAMDAEFLTGPHQNHSP